MIKYKHCWQSYTTIEQIIEDYDTPTRSFPQVLQVALMIVVGVIVTVCLMAM